MEVVQPADSVSKPRQGTDLAKIDEEGWRQQQQEEHESHPTLAGGTIPRRAFSTTDQPVAETTAVTQLAKTGRKGPQRSSLHTPAGEAALHARMVRRGQGAGAGAGAGPRPGERPVLPGPQRSYSVMDFVPVPLTHQPGTQLTLDELPPELHFIVFGFLDPIDSTCLGLTARCFYAVHRALHGSVSLATQREGPNDMEWVWRQAFIKDKQNSSLAMLTPRGQVYCRKCRTARCTLHNHIREWFPADAVEYCDVSHKFGRPVPDSPRPVCFRSSPRHPHRCGRHTRQQRQVRLT